MERNQEEVQKPQEVIGPVAFQHSATVDYVRPPH